MLSDRVCRSISLWIIWADLRFFKTCFFVSSNLFVFFNPIGFSDLDTIPWFGGYQLQVPKPSFVQWPPLVGNIFAWAVNQCVLARAADGIRWWLETEQFRSEWLRSVPWALWNSCGRACAATNENRAQNTEMTTLTNTVMCNRFSPSVGNFPSFPPKFAPRGVRLWSAVLLVCRIAAKPPRDEKRKGKNGSDPKLDCATRRRTSFCALVKNRALTREVSKTKSGSSLARVDWRREGLPKPRESS